MHTRFIAQSILEVRRRLAPCQITVMSRQVSVDCLSDMQVLSNSRSASKALVLALAFLTSATVPLLEAANPPKIQGVQVTNVTETTADMTWSTDMGATSE